MPALFIAVVLWMVASEAYHDPMSAAAGIGTRKTPLRVVEAKTSRSDRGWKAPDVIPPYYVPQVQHYLAVTGAEVADVPVLFGGSDYQKFTVERDGTQPEAWEMSRS
mgnify:CR=1 FL=1